MLLDIIMRFSIEIRHVHGSQSRIYDPRRSLDVWDWISDPIGSLMEMVVSDLLSKEIVDPSGSLAYIRL